MFRNNIILKTDFYKYSHHLQYPEGTTEVESYMVSRGGVSEDVVANINLQAIFLENFVGEVVTKEKIAYAKAIAKGGLGTTSFFNEEGWNYILEQHNGRLPLEICGVLEGSVIPVKNALLTVRNTDPKCFWLTSFVEGLLLHVW